MSDQPEQPKKTFHEFKDPQRLWESLGQQALLVAESNNNIVPNLVKFPSMMKIRDFYAHLEALLLAESPPRHLRWIVNPNTRMKWNIMPLHMMPGFFEESEELMYRGRHGLDTKHFGDHQIQMLFQRRPDTHLWVIEFKDDSKLINPEMPDSDSETLDSEMAAGEKSVTFGEFFDASAWNMAPADFNYNETEIIGTKSFADADKFRITIDNVLSSNVTAYAQELVSSTVAFMYAITRLRADVGPSDLRDVQTRDVKKKIALAVAQKSTFVKPGLDQYQQDFIVHLEDLSKFILSQSDKKKFVAQFTKLFETYDKKLTFEANIIEVFPYRGNLLERAKKQVKKIRGKTPDSNLNIREELTLIVKALTDIGGETSTNKEKDLVYIHLNLLIGFMHLLYTDVQQAETYFFKAKNVAAFGSVGGGLPPPPM